MCVCWLDWSAERLVLQIQGMVSRILINANNCETDFYGGGE